MAMANESGPPADLSADDLRGILEGFVGVEGAALPILHAVQERCGHVPEQAIPEIARFLNRSRAEIHGLVSFYHDFRTVPAGRHVIRVCRAEACQSMGGDAVATAFAEGLGVPFGETAADGRCTLEPVYCLGLCATAPAAVIDGRPLGRLTPERARRLAGEIGS